jgi:hypothetical protein
MQMYAMKTSLVSALAVHFALHQFGYSIADMVVTSRRRKASIN